MEPESKEDLPLIEGMNELPQGSFAVPRPPEGLREAVFARTARFVRGRSRRRRILSAAALIAVYAAGVATSRLLEVKTAEAPSPARVAIAPGEGAGAPGVTAPAVAPLLDPAAILRQVPRAAMADRIRLLKQAGDAYLLARGDLEGALDCYRQLLELAPPEMNTRPESDDTWLLAALRQGQTTHRKR